MAHMIEKEAIYFTNADGSKQRVSDVSFMFSPEQLGDNFTAWWGTGGKFTTEMDGNTPLVYRTVDENGKYTPQFVPLGFIRNGDFHLSGDVRMTDFEGNFIGKKTYQSNTVSVGMWDQLNPSGIYRHSDGLNLPTITEIGEVVGKHVDIPVTTTGRLGVNGTWGFFASHRLPKTLDTSVAALLGTQAHSFLTIFLDWRNGQIYVVNSQVMAVCYNTVMASIGSAVSSFYINLESNNQLEQIDRGLNGIMNIAYRNADELNSVLPNLVETKVDSDQVENVAKILFGGEVETNLSLGSEKSNVAERYARNQMESQLREQKRHEFHMIFGEGSANPVARRFGVTPQSESTAFGLLQLASGFISYQPTRDGNKLNNGFARMMIGTRAQTNRQVFRAVAKYAGMEVGADALEGVTW